MIKSGATGEMIEARVGDDILVKPANPKMESFTGKIKSIHDDHIRLESNEFIYEHQYKLCTLLHRPLQVGDEYQFKVQKDVWKDASLKEIEANGYAVNIEVLNSDHRGGCYRHKLESWRNATDYEVSK